MMDIKQRETYWFEVGLAIMQFMDLNLAERLKGLGEIIS
jgi:hypothetical protein